jgi:hypothetical protein
MEQTFEHDRYGLDHVVAIVQDEQGSLSRYDVLNILNLSVRAPITTQGLEEHALDVTTPHGGQIHVKDDVEGFANQYAGRGTGRGAFANTTWPHKGDQAVTRYGKDHLVPYLIGADKG